ncbi:MAG TPA: hypothetical protein VK835_06245 [Bacteroidia bacterium]|jgi:hypothetical protein|nr:hypothetical protein [Bacteroidia bacterium]
MEVKLIVIPLSVLVCMIYIIYKMVSSGKAHRKGAKKLRKKLLPMFYGKTSVFAKMKEN